MKVGKLEHFLRKLHSEDDLVESDSRGPLGEETEETPQQAILSVLSGMP